MEYQVEVDGQPMGVLSGRSGGLVLGEWGLVWRGESDVGRLWLYLDGEEKKRDEKDPCKWMRVDMGSRKEDEFDVGVVWEEDLYASLIFPDVEPLKRRELKIRRVKRSDGIWDYGGSMRMGV